MGKPPKNNTKKTKNRIMLFLVRIPYEIRYLAAGIFIGLSILLIGGGAFAYMHNKPNNLEPTPTIKSVEPRTIDTPKSTETNAPAKVQQDTTKTVCSQIDIAYGTIEKPAIWLYKGQTEIGNRGITGKKRICTDAQGKKTETVTSPAFDEVKYIGTKEYQQPPSTATEYTYEQALSLATQTCMARGYSPDSTDMTDCKNSELSKYGY